MADINTNQLIEVDAQEILKEFGLDDIAHTSTVVQQSDNFVTIPDMLEPPILDNNANYVRPISDATSVQSVDTVNLEAPQSQSPEIDTDAIAENFVSPTITNSTISSQENPIFDTEDIIEDINNEENDTDESEETALTTIDEPSQSGEDTIEVPQPLETQELSTEELLTLLPLNSKGFEINESTSRFSGAAWFEAIQKTTITLAGLGGIGSWVYSILSRMKPQQVFLYDDDIVETANLSGQMYLNSMVGKRKVDAMAEFVKDFSIYHGTIAIPSRFTKDTGSTDIMICGFDNMNARATFFNSWIRHLINHPHTEECLFIDGRLNIEEFQVFCIQGNDTYNIHKYREECLFSDYEAKGVQCSLKQTTYCSNMIGSIIVNLFTNFVANALTSTKPIIPRALPFKTYYDASMMYFKTEL